MPTIESANVFPNASPGGRSLDVRRRPTTFSKRFFFSSTSFDRSSSGRLLRSGKKEKKCLKSSRVEQSNSAIQRSSQPYLKLSATSDVILTLPSWMNLKLNNSPFCKLLFFKNDKIYANGFSKISVSMSLPVFICRFFVEIQNGWLTPKKYSCRV